MQLFLSRVSSGFGTLKQAGWSIYTYIFVHTTMFWSLINDHEVITMVSCVFLLCGCSKEQPKRSGDRTGQQVSCCPSPYCQVLSIGGKFVNLIWVSHSNCYVSYLDMCTWPTTDFDFRCEEWFILCVLSGEQDWCRPEHVLAGTEAHLLAFKSSRASGLWLSN